MAAMPCGTGKGFAFFAAGVATLRGGIQQVKHLTLVGLGIRRGPPGGIYVDALRM